LKATQRKFLNYLTKPMTRNKGLSFFASRDGEREKEREREDGTCNGAIRVDLSHGAGGALPPNHHA